MPSPQPRRVAILGGGVSGLAAAWELSRPELDDRFAVTVYERSWQLGGKGASSRGPHGRIEEHGLHVWLGYYDNAFRVLRDVYRAVDRPHTDPDCPIRGWRDALIPSDVVGAAARHGGDWSHWVARFSSDAQEPGTAGRADRPLSGISFFARGLRLLADFMESIRDEPPTPSPWVVMSASPNPPRGAAPGDFAAVVRQAEIAALIAAVESLHTLRAGVAPRSGLAGQLLTFLDRARDDLV